MTYRTARGGAFLFSSALLLAMSWGLESASAGTTEIKLRLSEFKDPLTVELEARLSAHPNDDFSQNFQLQFNKDITLGTTLGKGVNREQHGTSSKHSFTASWTANDLTLTPSVVIRPGRANPSLSVAATTIIRANGQTASALKGGVEVVLGAGTELDRQGKLNFGTTLIPDSQTQLASSWYDINLEIDPADGSLKPIVNLGQSGDVYNFSFSDGEAEIGNSILSAFTFNSSTQNYEVLQDTSLFIANFETSQNITETSFSTIANNEDPGVETTPEPTSIVGLFVLGTLSVASTLKRKLKSVKSNQKETTRVG